MRAPRKPHHSAGPQGDTIWMASPSCPPFPLPTAVLREHACCISQQTVPLIASLAQPCETGALVGSLVGKSDSFWGRVVSKKPTSLQIRATLSHLSFMRVKIVFAAIC